MRSSPQKFIALATSPEVQAEGIVKQFNWYPGIDAKNVAGKLDQAAWNKLFTDISPDDLASERQAVPDRAVLQRHPRGLRAQGRELTSTRSACGTARTCRRAPARLRHRRLEGRTVPSHGPTLAPRPAARRAGARDRRGAVPLSARLLARRRVHGRTAASTLAHFDKAFELYTTDILFTLFIVVVSTLLIALVSIAIAGVPDARRERRG